MFTFFSGCTYGFLARRGFTAQGDGWRRSMDAMFDRTGADTLLLPVAALQDHAYSVQMDWDAPDVMSEQDIRRCIAHARERGKRVILKAMVNCRDGYWRAYINFFDHEVPCEPRWSDWFSNYTAFNVYLARIAQDTGCELFCVGCEMVGTDRKAEFWRSLVQAVRGVYHGLVTYNCDKYQEDQVTWWDCLDLISSSGYYPIDRLPQEFERIDRVRRAFGKPFLFMECGCPCHEGSEYIPNNWSHDGKLDIDVQTRWYRAFTQEVLRHEWIGGVGWWDWKPDLYPLEEAGSNAGYCVYGKPAEQILFSFHNAVKERLIPEKEGE